MNKRYWFVVIDYNTTTERGKFNMGFVSDDENPFSNKAIKEAVVKHNNDLIGQQIVVVNFFEFKNANDYLNFWKQ